MARRIAIATTIALASLLAPVAVSGQTAPLPAFSCNTDLILLNWDSGLPQEPQLSRITTVNGALTTTPFPSTPPRLADVAYNPADDLLYGVNFFGDLLRIGADGSYENLGRPAGLTPFDYSYTAAAFAGPDQLVVGAVQGDQVFSRLQVVDLATNTVTKSFNVNEPYWDLAVNPLDGLLYGFNGNRPAIIDLVAGTATPFGTSIPPGSSTRFRPAALWFTADGVLLMGEGTQFATSQVGVNGNGTGLVSVVPGTAPYMYDGASCPDAVPVPPPPPPPPPPPVVVDPQLTG